MKGTRNNNIIEFRKHQHHEEQKNRLKEIRRKFFEFLAGICIMAPMVMIMAALFIDFTESEKSMMLVSIILGMIFLILADPEEAKHFIFDCILGDQDFGSYYDDDEDPYEEFWIESAQAYYDPDNDKFFYWDPDEEDYYYYD